MKILTPYDDSKPPRFHKINIDKPSGVMNITWEHNCHIKDQHPKSYAITITDLIRNETNSIKQIQQEAHPTWYTHKIRLGAKYNVSISPIENNSIIAYQIVEAPRLPTPENLTVTFLKNNIYRIDWDEIQFNETQ